MRVAGAVALALSLFLSHLANASTGHAETHKYSNQAIQAQPVQPAYREMVAEVTAYTDDINSCDKDDGITASGVHVEIGHIAMDESIPFGTRVHIEGMGEFVVTDRGGAITANRIDVYMPSHKQAILFGRQLKKVRIAEDRR
ncbi:MAG: 3D domain-containing protein [Negativicutes bacterium]|nr:3D domain-containing protein [Negativicutes bacterium]